MSTLASVIGRDITANRPAAGIAGRLFYDTTLTKMQRDNGSSWDDVEPPSLTNPMSHAGAMIYGGTGGTPTELLSAGATTKWLRGANGAAPTWDYPPGYEFDYAQITGNVTIVSTTEGTETSIIDGASVAYDGVIIVWIEFQVLVSVAPNAAAHSFVPVLYEDSTSLGRVGTHTPIFVSTQNDQVLISSKLRRTPSNASHTYHLKGWKSNASDTVTIGAGSGGSAANNAGWLRVIRAA